MRDAPGLRPFVTIYAPVQLVGLLLLPAVWAANMQCVSPQSPLGLRGMGARIDEAYRGVSYWSIMGVFAAGVFTLQLLALLGVWRPVPRLSRPPRLWLSALPAGLALVPLIAAGVMAAFAVVFFLDIRVPEPSLPRKVESAMPYIFLGAVVTITGLGAGVAWWVLVRRALRGSSYERAMARLCRGILVVVGALALGLVPLDIRARFLPGYASHLTFQPLTILGLVGLTVLGPILVFTRLDRLRAGWYAARCDRCGYEKGPPGEFARCPECALGWTGAQESAP